MPSTCFPFSMNSGHHPNTSPLVSPIFPITFSPSNRHTHLHKNSQSRPSTRMGSKHASCVHHLPPHIRHRSPRLHQRRVCQRLGELHDPPYAHGVVIPAPATMAAAPSGRRQTAATTPLFIPPPQLPSSSCRRWWKAPSDVDAQVERQAVEEGLFELCPSWFWAWVWIWSPSHLHWGIAP